MSRARFVVAFASLLALGATAHAQTMRAGDDPTLDPNYDPNKAAAPGTATTTTTTTTTRTSVAMSVPGGMPRTAFLFEARLSLGGTIAASGFLPGVVDNNGNAVGSLVPSVITQPSLLLGARLIDRLQVGLGISFVRIGVNGFSSNNLLFMPTVGFDMYKSRDNKNALYIKAGLGFGASIAKAGGVHDTSSLIGIDLALGARHALSSNFGIGFEAGLAANVANAGNSDQSDVVFIYGALVGSFWAGK